MVIKAAGRLIFLVVPTLAWTSTSILHNELTTSGRSYAQQRSMASPRQKHRLFAGDADDWADPFAGGSGDDGFDFGMGGMGSLDEGSELQSFAEQFLRREKQEQSGQDPSSKSSSSPSFTHCIAIPLDSNHELAVQLESVQKALIHECPPLVRSCIMPVKMRLPLLYIDASSSSIYSGRPSPKKVSAALCTLVEELVQKHFFVRPDVGLRGRIALNEDGIRPVALDFQKLVIQGGRQHSQHEVLSTQALKPSRADVEKNGHFLLEAFAEELEKHVCDVFGFTVMRATADHRFEVPFMRLPENFVQKLEPPKGPDGFRTPEEGGDGISPMFFFQYMQEVYGRNIRLRNVGIYPCESGASSDMTEAAFPIAIKRIALPKPSREMAEKEQQHENYHADRMKEATEFAMKEMGLDFEELTGMKNELDDSRDKLESLFKKDVERKNLWADDFPRPPPKDASAPASTTTSPLSRDDTTVTDSADKKEEVVLDAVRVEQVDDSLDVQPSHEKTVVAVDDQDEENDNEVTVEDLSSGNQEIYDADDDDDDDDDDFTSGLVDIATLDDDLGDDEPIPDWMQKRLLKIVEARNQEKLRQKRDVEAKAKNVDPDAFMDNPVLKAFREGTFIPDPVEPDEPEESLPAYPAREHFIGFWETVQSPFALMEQHADDNPRTDNFALRADGSIAGGPILVPSGGYRAGGGTWSVETVPSNDGSGDEVRLQIRCVLPPKRERIMVFDGLVAKGSDLPSMELTVAGSLLKDRDFLDNAFDSVRGKQAQGGKTDPGDAEKDALTCRGQVWVEDADTKANRIDVGLFLLQKNMVSTDRNKFVVTVQGQVRDQD